MRHIIIDVCVCVCALDDDGARMQKVWVDAIRWVEIDFRGKRQRLQSCASADNSIKARAVYAGSASASSYTPLNKRFASYGLYIAHQNVLVSLAEYVVACIQIQTQCDISSASLPSLTLQIETQQQTEDTARWLNNRIIYQITNWHSRRNIVWQSGQA